MEMLPEYSLGETLIRMRLDCIYLVCHRDLCRLKQSEPPRSVARGVVDWGLMLVDGRSRQLEALDDSKATMLSR